jgi:hypothetical protein
VSKQEISPNIFFGVRVSVAGFGDVVGVSTITQGGKNKNCEIEVF